MPNLKTLSFLISILFVSFAAIAAPGWTSIGPFGGFVYSVAVHPVVPSVVYAVSPYGGVFKTIDGAESWREINRGLPRRSASAIALDPQDANVAYVGLYSNGIYKTMDGGAFWSRLSNGLPDGIVQLLVPDPVNPSVVFAGYRDGWIYRTTDSGNSWSQVLAGTDRIRSIQVAPGDSNIVFASDGNGLSRSTDGGTSWLQVTGAPNGIGKIAIDPRDSNRLLFAASGENILLTTDGGSTWELRYSGLTYDIEIHPADPNLVLADHAVSTDGGLTWVESVHPDPCMPIDVTFDPTNPAIVFGNSGMPFLGKGVCKSTDGGATWRQANKGLNNTVVVHYALDPYNRGRMFAHTGQGNGLFYTKNGGGLWKDTGIAGHFYGSAILVHPSVPNQVYAGGSNGNQDPSVWRSTNGGATYSSISSEVRPYWTLTADPFDAGTLYCPTYEGVSKSVDGGFHWTPSQGMNTGAYEVAADPAVQGLLYAATPQGVMKSIDGGMNWLPSSNGLKDLSVGRLILDPIHPGTLYAATATGLFRTTNGGSEWKLRAAGRYYPTLSPFDSQTLYAGTPNGAAVSYDGGRTWRSIGLEGYSVYLVEVDPFDPAVLYAGTFGNGIYRLRLIPPSGVQTRQ